MIAVVCFLASGVCFGLHLSGQRLFAIDYLLSDNYNDYLSGYHKSLDLHVSTGYYKNDAHIPFIADLFLVHRLEYDNISQDERSAITRFYLRFDPTFWIVLSFLSDSAKESVVRTAAPLIPGLTGKEQANVALLIEYFRRTDTPTHLWLNRPHDVSDVGLDHLAPRYEQWLKLNSSWSEKRKINPLEDTGYTFGSP